MDKINASETIMFENQKKKKRDNMQTKEIFTQISI